MTLKSGQASTQGIRARISLLRKWKAQDKPRDNEPWIFELPLRVPQIEIDSLFTHVLQKLRSARENEVIQVGRIEELEESTLYTITKSI
jgi:hypothetical protein